MTAAADAARIAAALGKPERHGRDGWRCLCPAHDDASPSLDIDISRSGDRLLFQCRAGCDNRTILAALTSRGLWPLPDHEPSPKPGNGPRTAVSTARTHDPGEIRHGRYGPPDRVYRYTDAAGGLIGVVCRWNAAPGRPVAGSEKSKEILPAVPDGAGWRWAAMAEPRPLYRLPDIARRVEAQVLVVEGEKNADDAGDLLPDIVTTTWAGGAKAARKSDWSPLAGRRVVLWPDNDEPGQTAMATVAEILIALDPPAQVRVIQRDPDRPKGWDISDARAEGMDGEAIIEWASERAEDWTAPAAGGNDTASPPGRGASAAPRQPISSPAGGVSVSGGQAGATVVQLKPRETLAPSPGAEIAHNSDDHIALEFSRRHAADLRYVGAWGKWYHWCGTHWREEQTYLAFEMARRVAREFAAAANEFRPGSGKAIASAKTMAAVVKIAQGDRRHAVLPDVWDTDRWLLNTPGGTIDLRTAELRPPRQTDHITKMAGVAPSDMPTPVWDGFLDWMTCGDATLRDFLQRICGYALTGDTREHALFFLYGTGGNGKGTFLTAIIGCMGDYARTSPIDTFTEAKGERHPTELAMLRGARLVTAQETQEGRRWAEARIKELTGGDRISARFMRQDFFEFVPEFKLIIAGNHKPGLRSVDAAIRRRFHLIPFAAAIGDNPDTTLPGRLKAEWPGILQWMIDGCVAWQEQGLCPPEAVTAATEEYLAAEDALASWLADECDTGPSISDYSGVLYGAWKKWADANNEFAGSQKRFVQSMEAHGFARLRGPSGERMFGGVRLRFSG